MKKNYSKIIFFYFLIISFSGFAQSNNAGITLSPEIKNLYYSQKNKTYYYSIDSSNQAKAGFYILPEQTNSNITPTPLRIYCPSGSKLRELAAFYIAETDTPDYDFFFSYLYSFADNGTVPVFAAQDSDGNWLFEKEAFHYLSGYSEEYGWAGTHNFSNFFEHNTDSKFPGRFFLERFIFDKNKGFENPVSAFTYNGIKEAFSSTYFNYLGEGTFIENNHGIWYLQKMQDGSASLYKFWSETNQYCYSNICDYFGTKYEQAVSSLRTTEDSIIIKTQNKKYDLYNCKTLEEWIFSNDKELNKYLQNSYTQENSHTRFLKILLIILQFVILILFVVLSLQKICYLINQTIPVKRRYSFTQKELNKKIFDIQEKERQKLSRDIHDTVIQDIRVIGIEGDLLELSEGDTKNLEHKNKILKVSTDCIIKLRNICYNLAPAELSGHLEEESSQTQLISMLNTLSAEFTGRTHIPCSVKVSPDFSYPALSHEATENLFRIVQEALTNIERHAYATTVSIFMRTMNKDKKQFMIIFISDDGVGCNTKHLNLKTNAHRGLRNMKERMDLIGGEIEFFSKPNEGLEITLTLPVGGTL